ncbi:MAG: NAD(P)H-hydrate dehydratase [Candidatus Woesearchaeota archaeon]
MNNFYKLNIRNSESHKGENGRVLVIAGSKKYPGAGLIASEAGLRSGADLVYLMAPRFVTDKIINPSIIPVPLQGDHLERKHIVKFSEISKNIDSVVIGPGITESSGVKTFISEFLIRNKLPVVIDADALKLISLSQLSKMKNVMLTPHKKEFMKLFKQEANIKRCRERASFEKNIVICLKGKEDYVTDEKHIYINKSGNAGLTVGGTGDTLAGMIGSFIAQGNSLYQSAKTGVYVLGKTGDKLFSKYGYNYTVKEILEILPKEVKRFNSPQINFFKKIIG